MLHHITATLSIQAASREDARQIAVSAGEHLAETFNDDGSLQAFQVADADAISLPFALSAQNLSDLMTTAIENPYGAIRYWCDIGRCKFEPAGAPMLERVYTSFEADVQDGPVTCDHPDIEAAEIGRFTVDHQMLRDGIRRLLAPDANVSPSIRNDCAMLLTDPEHAADADTTDAIVQFAVFGELVFG